MNLVIQTAFLGDLILSIPLLKRIKENNPNEMLVLICKKGLSDFLIKEKIIDQAFEVEKNNRDSYKNILKNLKNAQVNNLYCIHKSIRSLLFVSQIKAKNKIGYSSFLGGFVFDQMVRFEEGWPEVMRQLKLLTPNDPELENQLLQEDWSDLNKVDQQGHFEKIPQEFAFSNKKNSIKKKKIALFPGSVWATKRWTPEGFAEVGNYFLKKGYQVDFMGGPDEAELCQQIAALAPKSNVLAGKYSIAETIQALDNYDLVVTNDSAPTHMASYKNIPVITIFGPTVLDFGFRPWTDQSAIVQNTYLECRPCGKHGPQVCPLSHHLCMKDIKAQSVIKAAEELLNYPSV